MRVEKPVARHQPEEWHRSNKALREASEDVRTTSHDLRHQALHLRHQASTSKSFKENYCIICVNFSYVKVNSLVSEDMLDCKYIQPARIVTSL